MPVPDVCYTGYGRIATLGKNARTEANYSQSDHHYNGAMLLYITVAIVSVGSVG